MKDSYQRKSFPSVKTDSKGRGVGARNEKVGHDVSLVQTDAIKSLCLFIYSVLQLANGRS